MTEANTARENPRPRLDGAGPEVVPPPTRRSVEEGDHGPSSGTDAASSVERDLDPVHEAALRALNYVVALVGLLVTSPLMLAIAVAIKLDSGGPVLYRQLRVGKDRRQQQGPEIVDGDGPSRRTADMGGAPFCLYKFRTMHQHAESGTGPTWSSPADARTTRVGRFLRRHRLDELPQLWNVLKGDMALVGPRPERPLIFQRLREQIGGYTKRQTVRPGITGWAQINRASDRTVDDVERKLRYDLEYVNRRSLGFDASVMLKTPLVMARPDLVERAADGDARQGDAPPAPRDAVIPLNGDLARMLRHKAAASLGKASGTSGVGSEGRENGEGAAGPFGRVAAGAFEATLVGDVTDANDALAELLGFASAQELVGSSLAELEDARTTVRAEAGIAVYPEHGGSLEEIIRAADQAMYRSRKSNGDVERREEARDRAAAAVTATGDRPSPNRAQH